MNETNLYGLVLCGGKSSRMGHDKGLIDYHGQPQRYHMYDMLKDICAEVYLSFAGPTAVAVSGHYNILIDEEGFADKGPLTGLLTAFETFPDRDFLITGCDYPLLKKEDLESFIQTIPEDAVAAAYYNQQEDLYEPLIAYYSSAAGREMINNYRNIHSLQQFLQQQSAHKYYPGDPLSIKSADTPEEEATVRQLIAASNK